MLIAAVLCLCAAVATAGLGLWLLTRPRVADPVHQVLRAVAPTQLAAAVMLTAGGVVALSGVRRRCGGHGRGRVLAERQGGRTARGRSSGRRVWWRVRDVHVVLSLSPGRWA
jgi:hypothetical protein